MLKSATERVLSFVDQLSNETVVEQRCIPVRHDVLRLRLGSLNTPLWQRCKIDGLRHGLASQHWLPFAVQRFASSPSSSGRHALTFQFCEFIDCYLRLEGYVFASLRPSVCP